MVKQIKFKRSPIFHVVIDGCFGVDANRKMLGEAISLREHYEPATLGDGKVHEKFRANLVCDLDRLLYKPEFMLVNGMMDMNKWKPFRSKESHILKAVDELIGSARMRSIMDAAPYPLCKFQDFDIWGTQISHHGGNGGLFAWHRDRYRDAGDRRVVNMVYYMHKYPKSFHGGELLLSDGPTYEGELLAGGSIVKLQPLNDRLVIFESRTSHCVKPTSSTGDFEDGRFAVTIGIGKMGPLDEDNQL